MAASSFAIGVNCLLILRGFLGAFRSRPLQGFASLELQDGGSEAPETLCLEPGAGRRETRAKEQHSWALLCIRAASGAHSPRRVCDCPQGLGV